MEEKTTERRQGTEGSEFRSARTKAAVSRRRRSQSSAERVAERRKSVSRTKAAVSRRRRSQSSATRVAERRKSVSDVRSFGPRSARRNRKKLKSHTKVQTDPDSLAVAYASSNLCKRMMRSYLLPPALNDASQSKYTTDFWNEFKVVYHRTTLHKLRDPTAVLTQASIGIMMPLLIGSLFFQMGLDQRSINDRIRVVSLLAMMMTFMTYDVVLLFPLERALYVREHDAGLYRCSSFYLGRSLAELPFHLLFSVMAALISYAMFGFWHFTMTQLCQYTMFVVLITISAASMMTVGGALAKNIDASTAAVLPMFLLQLFDGTWIAVENIPAGYRWMRSISFQRYGVQGLLTVAFEGLEFEVPSSLPEEGGQFFRTGDDVLAFLEIQDADLFANAMYMLAFNVGARVLTYYAFRTMYTGKPAWERLKE